jgi:hypothetical protein
MKPIGLTMKKSRNKYRLDQRGELMLVHECTECGALSINRIAADDDPESIVEVFNTTIFNDRCEQEGIALLNADDSAIVFAQLYGLEVMAMA